MAWLGARSRFALKLDVHGIEKTFNEATADLKVLLPGASGTQFEVISWELGLDRIRSGEPD